MAVVAAPATVGRAARTRGAVRRWLAWHPAWWVHAVAAWAWAALLVMAWAPSSGGGAMAAHEHGMAAPGTGFLAGWTEAWGHWTLMIAAMMLPVVAPQVRVVARRSLWTRQQRSAAAYVAGYLAVWVAAGALLLAPLVLLDAYPLGTPWLVAVLLVAAVWQVSRPRRRVLRRCAGLKLGAATGRAADRDCAREGVRAGGRCLVTCGPVMLSMLAGHSLVLMAGLLLVLLSERSRGPDPLRRVGRPREAWVLVGFAVVAGAVALT